MKTIPNDSLKVTSELKGMKHRNSNHHFVPNHS